MEEFVVLWREMPGAVISYVSSIAANVTTSALSKTKKEEFGQLFSEAMQEGCRRLLMYLGLNSFKSVKALLDSEDLKTLLIRSVWNVDGESDKQHRSEEFKRLIYSGKIPLDELPTLDGLDMVGAIQEFNKGFEDVAQKNGLLAEYLDSVRTNQISITVKKISKNTEQIAKNTEPIKTIAHDIADIKKHIVSKPGRQPSKDLPELKNEYFNFIREKFGTVSTEGLGKGFTPIPLEKIYTRLVLRKTNPEKIPVFMEEDLEVETERRDPRMNKEDSINFADIIESRYAVVIGAPGGGKTTLLKFIALALVNEEQEKRLGINKTMLPIYFPVSALVAKEKSSGRSRSIGRFIPEFYLAEELSNLSQLFSDATAKGNALYLIDGLDEVQNEAKRKRMIERIHSFMIKRKQPGNRFIVSCRTASYGGTTQFGAINGKELPIYHVPPFAIKQIRSFLKKYYRHYHCVVQNKETTFESETKKSLSRMMNLIKSDKNLLSLATNPLMLFILTLVEHDAGELPRTRRELYQRCLKMLAGTWEILRNKFVEREANFRLGDTEISERFIIRHLGPVAKRMHEGGVRTIDHQTLENELAIEFKASGESEVNSYEKAASFIKILKEQSGIIRETAPEVYGFSHQTFKEFLTALILEMRSRDIIKELGDHLYEAEWREVILLYFAGLRQEYIADDFIEKLRSQNKSDFKNLILAGECLIDAGEQMVSNGVLNRLVSALRTEAFGTHKPVLRAPIAEILGHLGGDDRDLWQWLPVKEGIYHFQRNKIRVSAFEVGKYPVTNGKFHDFVDDKGYKNEDLWSTFGKKWLRATKAEEPNYWHDHNWTCPTSPVVGVSWYEASAFCRWLTLTQKDGWLYRLPNQDQWEAAAAGSYESGEYPAGSANGKMCNTRETKINKTSPVGLFESKSEEKIPADMAGNVWEWTRSSYHDETVETDFPLDDEILKLFSRADFSQAWQRHDEKGYPKPVLRGGSWFNFRGFARCAYRIRGFPNYRNDLIGFRCVRTKN